MVICVISMSPSREPQFHQLKRFDGVGRSTSAEFTSCRMGASFRGIDIFL